MRKPWHYSFIFLNTELLRTHCYYENFPSKGAPSHYWCTNSSLRCLALLINKSEWWKINIILTVLHAHSQSHIITASILIFSDTRPRPVQIRQTNEELMKYQHSHSSLHFNLHAKWFIRKIPFPATSKWKTTVIYTSGPPYRAMNRKREGSDRPMRGSISTGLQLVWLVLYSTLMSWNSQKIKKKKERESIIFHILSYIKMLKSNLM